MDCSPPDSSVHRILQARILKWVVTPSSRGSSWSRDQNCISCTAGGLLTIWATREAKMRTTAQETTPQRALRHGFKEVVGESQHRRFLVKGEEEECFASVVSESLWSCGLYVSGRLLCLGDSPGKNTGEGCHFLFQIFPIHGSNAHFSCLLHRQVGPLPLAPPGNSAP